MWITKWPLSVHNTLKCSYQQHTCSLVLQLVPFQWWMGYMQVYILQKLMGYRKQLSRRSIIYLTKYIISFLFITLMCKRLTWCCSFTPQHPSLTDMSMKKRKRSRWSSETPDQKTVIPGMPTVIPPGLTREQERAYIGNYEIWFFFLSEINLFCWWTSCKVYTPLYIPTAPLFSSFLFSTKCYVPIAS